MSKISPTLAKDDYKQVITIIIQCFFYIYSVMLSSSSHNLFLQSYFLKLQSQSLLHKRKKVKIYPQSLLHNMFSHVTWLWMRDMIVLLGIHLLQTLSGPSKPSCISIVGNYDCYLCLLGRYSSSTERVALNHSITPTTLYLISRFSLAL